MEVEQHLHQCAIPAERHPGPSPRGQRCLCDSSGKHVALLGGGGSLGFKMVPCLAWVTPGTCRTRLCMHQVRSKREDVCLGLAL